LVVKAMSSQKMINNPLLNNEKNFQRLWKFLDFLEKAKDLAIFID
jgi:hypothetical protein